MQYFSSYLSVLHARLTIKVLAIITDTLRTGCIMNSNKYFNGRDKLNELKGNDKKMGVDLKETDIGELVNSLQNIEKAIRKIEKELGIKEAPLPTIDLEENFRQTNEKVTYTTDW